MSLSKVYATGMRSMQSGLYQKWDKKLNPLLAVLEGICTSDCTSDMPSKNIRTVAMPYIALLEEDGTMKLDAKTQEILKYPAQEEHESMAEKCSEWLMKELKLL